MTDVRSLTEKQLDHEKPKKYELYKKYRPLNNKSIFGFFFTFL